MAIATSLFFSQLQREKTYCNGLAVTGSWLFLQRQNTLIPSSQTMLRRKFPTVISRILIDIVNGCCLEVKKMCPTVTIHHKHRRQVQILITLGLFNIAMENGPFIDDFPIKTNIYRGFSMAMLNNQMVPKN